MWHDTWSFRLDDTVELLTWLHEVLPELDRRVEPVVAATRLPDVPLHEGTVRPDGTVPDGRFASYLTADPERLNVHG
jgi:hypothetical protein